MAYPLIDDLEPLRLKHDYGPFPKQYTGMERKKMTEEDQREMAKDTRRLVDVAAEWGVDPSTVSRARAAFNPTMSRTRLSRLIPDEKRRAIASWPESVKRTAERFGVGESTVSRCRREFEEPRDRGRPCGS